MKVTHPPIAPNVSEYVKGMLVIENYQRKKPFILPLFANGTPTLIFQTSRARIKTQTNHLTLFGQTVSPDQILIQEEFYANSILLNTTFPANAIWYTCE